ncbi:MAG: AAA family ATPase [Rhodobacteraceae bacterium]|nr:AAA family ATPase [Paracoccaceae bacterium]
MPHTIVVGNEKGGAGKSTVSMHVATALVRMGHRVNVMDLDLRQQSLGRYLSNRAITAEAQGISLPMPNFFQLPDIPPEALSDGENQYDARMGAAVAEAEKDCDFLLIDCPGSHTRLSQVAHMMADTLVTPLNDSFIDFDMLGRIDPQTEKILGPSVYSEMVWKARQARAQAGLKPVDWVVLRNRIGSQKMLNKAKMETAVAALSKRIRFRVAPGFSERVIFRELFPKGLTLLDLRDAGAGRSLSISNIAARQELRDMMKSLKLPDVEIKI